jgi:plastocyanin
MSIVGRRISVKATAALAALMLLSALLPAMSGTPTREITLVARGMAFYLDGAPDEPNPTIEAKAGERVRIELRNEERGMTHDFAVPAVDAATDAIDWRARARVTFDAPATPGTYEYVCRPHRLMMKGVIRVIGD